MIPKTLIWCDLETTGLDPNEHRVLEIFTAIADLQDPFHGREQELHHVFSFRNWEEVEDAVIAMHSKSGLLAACVAADPGPRHLDAYKIIDRELVQKYMPGYALAQGNPSDLLIPPVKAEDKLVLAGSSVHFDLGFIRSHFPAFAQCLSHKVYDVSAIKLFCYSMGMPEIPKGEEAHRAREDVICSIDHAKKCWEWLVSERGKHEMAKDFDFGPPSGA